MVWRCRFANPLDLTAERFVWDYWHVPDQYTLLRTPADQFFPEEAYQQLEDALLEYGEEHLGCRGMSPVWLSYYVDGCRQVSTVSLSMDSFSRLPFTVTLAYDIALRGTSRARHVGYLRTQTHGDT